MSPQKWSCLDCEVNCPFLPGRYSACQGARWHGAALSFPLVPPLHQTSFSFLALGSRRTCPLCFRALWRAGVENSQGCGTSGIPTGSSAQAFKLAGHLTTWALKPEDHLWVAGVKEASPSRQGVLSWNSLSPRLKYVFEASRSKLFISTVRPENLCPSKHLAL